VGELRFTQSLKFNFLLWILGAFFLASIGQSLVSYWSGKDILIQQIQENCTQIADATGDEIDAWIAGKFSEMSTLAKLDEVRNLDAERLPALLSGLMSADHDNLYVVWPDGTVVGDTGLQDFKLDERNYFKLAMAGKANIDTPVISKATGNLVAPIAVPIYQGDKVVGVLGATIKAEKITEITSDVKVGETGYAYLINQDTTFVAHPKKDYILQKKLSDDAEGMEDVIKRMTALETGIAEYEYDGEVKYMAYDPVHLAGWSLAVTVPVSEVTQPLDAMLHKMIMVTIVTLLLLSIIIWFVTGRLTKPILGMVDITTRLSQRDLTQEIESRNRSEIGLLMNSLRDMNENLNTVLKQMAGSSERLASVSEDLMQTARQTGQASEQVSASAEEVARAATAEAEDAQKTSELVQQVGMAMQNVGSTTEAISSQSLNFKSIVGRVTGLMLRQKDEMALTVNSTVNVAGVIEELSNKTQEIGEIINVINNIAGQTNLLALNAAIEAARAGEAGRGFAVVAEEVRKLAEETGSATLNIATIINEVQAGVERAVAEVDKVEKQVREQGVSLGESVDSFREIEQGAVEIDNAIQDISATFEELLASADEMTQAIENISAATEESAASAEEVTAISQNQLAAVQNIVTVSQELDKLAVELKKVTDTFKLK
jgi:methyl-accepting chemotaxis protein